MNAETNSGQSNAVMPREILPVAFDELRQAALEEFGRFCGGVSESERIQRLDQLQDFIFNLESMVFLDGERRGESIRARLLRWSGPGFTRRFYQRKFEQNEETFLQDQKFVAAQFEELLALSHYHKVSSEVVEKALEDTSYERIFVRLQNVSFLNFYVRGSYLAKQPKTIARTMVKRIQPNEEWGSALVSPDDVEVFEEIVVIASEEISEEEEARSESKEENPRPCPPLSREEIQRELAPYLNSKDHSRIRRKAKRKKAIQHVVLDKMRSLQGKTLDDIMAEHTPDSNCVKYLHLLVYHNIPATDLELLLPNAEISLGIKEYIQLCFTGTATLPALGNAIITRGLRKLLMVFNPFIYAIYRVLYKINVVRTEQKYLHARYLLNHRLARGGKAVSHLIDDYENVLKREALLVILLLVRDDNPQGRTRSELEERAKDFAWRRWDVPFEPDFSSVLRVLRRWEIVEKNSDGEKPRYTIRDLDSLTSLTKLTRSNLQGKIWME